MRHWRTTGNSMWPSKPEVLISPTVWHISLQFRLQTWGFRLRRARRKCLWHRSTTGNSDWPPKPEVVIPPELQQIASKFQRQVRDFRPRRARIKCRQVIATMIDNRKWQCGPQNRKYLYLWNYDRWQFQWHIWGFRPRPARRNWPRANATTTDNRKRQYIDVLAPV